MVQGAPPGMHKHADRTYVTITPPSCSPGHGHTLGAVSLNLPQEAELPQHRL